MSDALLIIVVDSAKVGFIPALVRHQEVEIWAEGEEVEEETRDLDDWEIVERKAARQAKIVAVPLGWFQHLWKLHFLVMSSANQMILEYFGHYELLLLLSIPLMINCNYYCTWIHSIFKYAGIFFTRVIVHTCVRVLLWVYQLILLTVLENQVDIYVEHLQFMLWHSWYHSYSICTHAVYVCAYQRKQVCVCVYLWMHLHLWHWWVCVCDISDAFQYARASVYQSWLTLACETC